MVVVKVWCLPKLTEKRLKELHMAIVDVVALDVFKAFDVKNENDMVCLFPPDMMTYGLGSEIVVEVVASENKDITADLQGRLIARLGATVRLQFPKAKVICFIQSISSSQRFWTSD